MKTIAIVVVMCLPSIICALAAGYMAIHGVTGWGWFLFVSCLLFVSSYKDKTK